MTPKRSIFFFLGAVMSAVLLLTALTAFRSHVSAQTNCSVSISDQSIDAEEQQLLDLVNQYRVANGKTTLTFDTNVTRASAWLSRDMATNNPNPLSHQDSLGRDVAARLTQCGVSYTTFAENIAAGNASGQATFNQWTADAPHRATMLADGVTVAGVARVFDSTSTFGWYWTLDVTGGGPTATTTTLPVTTTTLPVTTTTLPVTTTTLPVTTTTLPGATTTTTPHRSGAGATGGGGGNPGTPGGADPLPRTGTDIALLVAFAMVTSVLGAWFIVVARHFEIISSLAPTRRDPAIPSPGATEGRTTVAMAQRWNARRRPL